MAIVLLIVVSIILFVVLSKGRQQDTADHSAWVEKTQAEIEVVRAENTRYDNLYTEKWG